MLRGFGNLGSEAESDAIRSGELLFAMTDSANLEDQLEQVFAALRVPVYQYLYSLFGDSGEAEDIAQDAFLQLYKTLLKGQEVRNVRYWIFRVAHNLAINRIGNRQFVTTFDSVSWEQFERNLTDSALNPEQAMLRREKYERLFNGLKRLTMNERQCLYLRAEGFRYREIADIMGVGVPTVGEYLRRSITKLGE
jgi:RNA polymerase sigma-70 factor (ECF subfamily)